MSYCRSSTFVITMSNIQVTINTKKKIIIIFPLFACVLYISFHRFRGWNRFWWQMFFYKFTWRWRPLQSLWVPYNYTEDELTPLFDNWLSSVLTNRRWGFSCHTPTVLHGCALYWWQVHFNLETTFCLKVHKAVIMESSYLVDHFVNSFHCELWPCCGENDENCLWWSLWVILNNQGFLHWLYLHIFLSRDCRWKLKSGEN